MSFGVAEVIRIPWAFGGAGLGEGIARGVGAGVAIAVALASREPGNVAPPHAASEEASRKVIGFTFMGEMVSDEPRGALINLCTAADASM